jgi:DNA-binding CsgD family transcriptional regulator
LSKGVIRLEDLIREYRKSLRLLRSAKTKPLFCGSMVSDAEFAIEYMATGHIPGTKWTVARWPLRKREIPVDPIMMARFVQNREPIAAAPDHVVRLLESLLKSLSPLERDAYELVRGRGYSFKQSGKLLGCSKASAQSYVKRAEKKIRLAIR